MEANDREMGGADSAEESLLFSVGLPLLALMITTGALYLARDILIPLSAALVMGVVLSPIASRFERVVGRFFGAMLVVLSGVMIIAAVAYFTTLEMTVVADEVAGYSDNIGNKLAALEKNTPLWLQHLEAAVHDIEQRMEKSNSHLPRPKPTPTVTVSSGSFTESLERATVAIPALFEFLVVVVLLFFLLYGRRDLRDRFVRLAARARITVASQAIETAGHTVGRYLLLLTLINLAFGTSIGLVLFALGLPNPEFWGLLAFLLRYVPYVGAVISSMLPALVAFAVFPGWSKSLMVIGSFVALDQITAQMAEPFLIGSGIDMSPVALLIATIYWSWLWGVPGLLLAIPLTACLKVAGEHIPALNFLPLLLGGERLLETHDDFYRMLLELDSAGPRALAIRYCDENGIEKTFDDILVPAISMAGDEHSQGHISDESMQHIIGFLRDLIPELGTRFCKLRTGQRVRVAGVCPPDEVHNLGLLIVLELFRSAGAAVKFVGEGKSTQEIRELTRLFSPDVMCLSCTVTECLPAAAELTANLKREFPHLRILAGGVAALSYPADLLRAGCLQVCGSRSQTHRAIRQLMALRRRPSIPIISVPADTTRNAAPETKVQ
jgi:predicted PurR-regulated permease PerM/methylmalonyl-CoA mutase cobalamin-binding subunit